MKERLVEDWLIRINERGYELSFCQILLSKGFRILRFGHSPTEHGKDVLAIAPDGSVHGYQLKTGDMSQSEISKYHGQLNMLVEARPIHPALPPTFDYRPFLVTTGEFKDPAVSFIKELNAGWRHRGLPSLGLVNGRELQIDLVALSSDFWPVEPPAVRKFRELYLVDGRGDLDLPQFAQFQIQILQNAKSPKDLERRAAAANIFASYLLEEFNQQHDYWSLCQGWTVCAAQIAWAGESAGFPADHWKGAFELAKDAALDALASLHNEVLKPDAFRVWDRELDDITRARNTIALSAAACWQLTTNGMPADSAKANLEKVKAITCDFLERGRLFLWGEGAVSHFLPLFWLLEIAQQVTEANSLLLSLIGAISQQNSIQSVKPLADPYKLPDECLARLLKPVEVPRKLAVESYALFPLVLLATRRKLRAALEELWPQISYVTLTWFEAERPADKLLWHCSDGKEYTTKFSQPQSWTELCEVAYRDRSDHLPTTLRNDANFCLLFELVFPHRITAQFIKHLDSLIQPQFNKRNDSREEG